MIHQINQFRHALRDAPEDVRTFVLGALAFTVIWFVPTATYIMKSGDLAGRISVGAGVIMVAAWAVAIRVILDYYELHLRSLDELVDHNSAFPAERSNQQRHENAVGFSVLNGCAPDAPDDPVDFTCKQGPVESLAAYDARRFGTQG